MTVDEPHLNLLAQQLNCEKVYIFVYIPRHVKQPGMAEIVILIPRIKVCKPADPNAQKTHVLLPDFLLPYTRYTDKSMIFTMAADKVKTPEKLESEARRPSRKKLRRQKKDEEKKKAKEEKQQRLKMRLPPMSVLNLEVANAIDTAEWDRMANLAEEPTHAGQLRYLRSRFGHMLRRWSQSKECSIRPSKFPKVALRQRDVVESYYIKAQHQGKTCLFINQMMLFNDKITVCFLNTG